jgi:uncharacterized protein
VEWLEIFDNFQATVSISCDGPPDAHNAHRVGFNGGETSSAVEKAIKLCLDYPGNIFNGILAVVDPCFNGADTVRYFYGLGVRNMDFLLPDSNYVTPPLHITDYSHEKMDAFLKAAFDCWIAYQDPGFSIRIFETFIKGVLGKRSDLDAFGGDLSPILVVESDGSYRLLDVLAICEDGIAKTSLDVTTNSIDHFLEISRNAYPEHAAFCGACPAFTACGGGYLAHRFNGASYVNPSFYCPVLFSLYKYTVSYLQSVWIAATPAGLPDLPLLEGFKTVLMENYNSIIRPNAEMNVGR